MKALLVALLVAGLSGRALAADDGNQGGEEPNKQGQAADNRHHQKEEKKPRSDRLEHEKTAARETPNKGGQGSPQQRAEKINTVLKEQNVPPAAGKIIQQAMTAGYAGGPSGIGRGLQQTRSGLPFQEQSRFDHRVTGAAAALAADYRGEKTPRQYSSPAAAVWDARTAADEAQARATPTDSAASGRVGVDYYQGGDSASARAWLERSLRGGYQSPDVLTAYGGVAYDARDYELAQQAAQRALSLDPASKPAQALAGLSHGRVSAVHLPSALPAEAAAAPAPRAEAVAAAAAAAAEPRRSGELEAVAAKQAAAPPPPPAVERSAAITRQAEDALRIGDYANAYARAAEATSLNNRNAQAWNYRAMAASNLGRFSDAVHDASYAVTLEPSQAAPWVTRSWAYAQQGRYADAETDARAALERAPNNAYAYHDLSFALAGEGRRPEALEALRLAAAADARFKPKYDAAVQLAQDSDMTMLFRQGAEPSAPPPAPAPRGRRFLTLLLLSLTGGLLVALGLLQTAGESLRSRVTRTLRRALSSPPPPAPAAVTGGADIGDLYELSRKLGEGGMGVVYEARDRALDRRVAIKRMREEIRSDPTERRRFIQEARAVAALNHPNVVSLYSILERDNDLYLIFEHVRGRTLADALRRGSLPFVEARRLMAAICAAVEHAHRQKIIHRDLKPSNIMISDEGVVKVMDFGVARQAKDVMTKKMLTNTIVGTPPYMAPEQEQGLVRPESDVFALGVILFEMLTGELPFAGLGAGMLLNKMNGKHELVSAKARHPMPPGLDAVVARALAADPDRRFRSPAELMAALDGLAVPLVA